MISQADWEILVNQVAQNIRGPEDAIAVFDSMPEAQKRDLLRRVNVLVVQAGSIEGDIEQAIVASGVRPTRTAAVVLASGRVGMQLAKVAALPDAELSDGLLLAMSLLAIADQRRRRSKCVSGCNHWWHQDLRDEMVLKQVRSGSSPQTMRGH